MSKLPAKRMGAVDREYIAFDLPAPISVNALWTIRKNRATGKPYLAKTKEYESWLTECGWAINVAKPGFISGWYNIRITVGTHCGIDLDNAPKAVSDFCQLHGIIDNDKFAASVDLRWHKDVPGISVMLTRTSAPAGKAAA